MTPNSSHESGSGHNVAEYSVTELSFALKNIVENQFSYVRVRGELGRISRPASGHIYLDLKDEKSVLAGVVWKGQVTGLQIEPEQGLEVIATGRLTTYPGQSKYQIVIEAMEPAGIGALMALLEERKKKLEKEGLFDEERKQLIPYLPRVIGIVTSPTGAVIRDMIHGFEERFPAHVIVWPVRVQGDSCKDEVANAIKGFNALTESGPIPRPDVLIVARGGGSLEDLWGFNEEIVARAAAESEIALISAVGHETDWTLIDFVADSRAPTPTKAAEWAVPKFSELLERNNELTARLHLTIRRLLEQRRANLMAASRGLPRPGDLIALSRQRFDGAASRLERALISNFNAHVNRYSSIVSQLSPSLRIAVQSHRGAFDRTRARLTFQPIRMRLEQYKGKLESSMIRLAQSYAHTVSNFRRQLDGLAQLLNTLGYQQVLARGFALVRDNAGHMVRSVSSIKPSDLLQIQFVDGAVKARSVVETSVDPDGGNKPQLENFAANKETKVENSQGGIKKSRKSEEKTENLNRNKQGSLF